MALTARNVPWTSQPTGAAIRAKDPAAWKALYVPTQYGAVDAVSGAVGYLRQRVSAVPSIHAGSVVRGDSLANSNQCGVPFPAINFAGVTEVSIFSIIVFTGFVGAGGVERFLMRYDSPTDITSGVYELAYFYDSGAGFPVRVRPLVSTGVSSGWTASNDVAFPDVTLGVPYLVLMRWRDGIIPECAIARLGTVPNIFAGGSVAVTGAVVARGSATDQVPHFCGGGYFNGGSGTPEGDVLLCGIAHRCVGDAEFTAISRNPWSLIAPRRVFAPAGPGFVVPVLSAPGATDITSSSARPRVSITF